MYPTDGSTVTFQHAIVPKAAKTGGRAAFSRSLK